MKTDNEIIAEFVGGKISMTYRNYTTFKNASDLQEAKKHGWEANLHYDTSWDKLIPCLAKAKEKIKSAGWGTPMEDSAKKRLNAALNELYNLNIKNTHYCLVKFIQWYNDSVLIDREKDMKT